MLDCFFYVEPAESGKEDEATIRSLCIECRQKHFPKEFPTWFYSGQVGPWTVKCRKCDKIIYLHKVENNINTLENRNFVY